MTDPFIAIVGGANIDIIAVPDHRVLPGDSAPGRISFTPGGVGRNIAQALMQTGKEEGRAYLTELITALGDDDRSRFVRELTEKAGVSLEHSFTFSGRSCPAYAAVMDGGDLLSGVNDMGLLKELTPEKLEEKKEILDKADLIVLDANLEQESLDWLCGNIHGTPLFAETVSAVKCVRFAPLLSRLYGIKPNRMEAEALTGRTIGSAEEALECAAWLNSRGADNVIITLGRAGSVYYSSSESGIIETPPRKAVEDVTGAGDYYLAGALPSLLGGSTLEEASRAGARCAWRKLSGEL